MMHFRHAALRAHQDGRPHAFGWRMALALLILVMAVSGCARIPSPVDVNRTVQHTIDYGAGQMVRSLRAELTMGAGEITVVRGNAGQFVGDLSTANLVRSPEVSYEASYGEGLLRVRQASGNDRSGSDVWALRFGNDVPLDLDLTLGAGRARLELQDLALSGVRIATGAGEVYADLSGPRDGDFYADIKGGVGHLTVILPAQVGVLVDARGGLGSIRAPEFTQRGTVYTNDLYGVSDVTIHVSVDAGIGLIELKLR